MERTCFYDSEDDSEDESDVETAQPEQQQQQQHQLQKQPDDTARHRSLHRFALALEGLHRQINMVHMPAVDAPPVPEPAPISPGGPNHLKGRIQRLRAVGWARKRFDPSRYEALREEAMMDLLK